MAPLRCAAKFDPVLSLHCAPTPYTLAQSKERKGSNFAIWQPWTGSGDAVFISAGAHTALTVIMGTALPMGLLLELVLIVKLLRKGERRIWDTLMLALEGWSWEYRSVIVLYIANIKLPCTMLCGEQGGLSGRRLAYVDIKFKVPWQDKLLPMKHRIKSKHKLVRDQMGHPVLWHLFDHLLHEGNNEQTIDHHETGRPSTRWWQWWSSCSSWGCASPRTSATRFWVCGRYVWPSRSWASPASSTESSAAWPWPCTDTPSWRNKGASSMLALHLGQIWSARLPIRCGTTVINSITDLLAYSDTLGTRDKVSV